MELMRKQKLAREAKKNALKTKTSSSVSGGQGGTKSRYSAGVNTPEKKAADKKRNEEREASKKARVERSKAKASRRGTGVSNRTDNPIGGGKKKVTKSKGKGGGVTINGKPPTSIQKKLLAGGWSAKELEAKINRKKK